MTRFYRRRFLNKRGHHAGAYVLAEVSLERHALHAGSRVESVDAWLTVADCARVTQLDFTANSPSEANNALHKARELREVVVDFTAALEEAVQAMRSPSSS